MNIDRNSWHYKVVMFSGYDEPRSLCAYFWVFVAKLTLMPIAFVAAAMFALVALLVVLVCVINPVFTLIGYLFWGIEGSFLLHMFGDPWGTGPEWFSVLASSVIWGLIVGNLYQEYKKRVEYDQDKPAVLSAVDVAISFFAAKKRKVCPLIEYQGRR